MAKIKFFTLLRKATGEQAYESSARDVGTLLEEVRRRYGDEITRYLDSCVVLVNGQNVGHLSGKRTKLSPDDEVSLIPPVAGG